MHVMTIGMDGAWGSPLYSAAPEGQPQCACFLQSGGARRNMGLQAVNAHWRRRTSDHTCSGPGRLHGA